MDTRPRTFFISLCTVQLRTVYAAHFLATLCLCTTSGPDPGEFPGLWGSMVVRHAPISRKVSGKQQLQQQSRMGASCPWKLYFYHFFMQVFLQHLNPLLTLPTFTALWLTILDFMDKYMHIGKRDLLVSRPCLSSKRICIGNVLSAV